MKLSKFNTYSSFGTSLLWNRMTNKRSPMLVALAITGRCNFNCSYCYGNYPNRKDEDFTLEQIYIIIDDLVSLGSKNINLIGGEPLLRKDIKQIIEYIKSKGLICHISTNASLIPSRINDILGADAILTSLDGLEEFNDKNRGIGTFNLTMNGIKVALEHGLTVHVNSVLTKNNVDSIDAMVSLAKQTGFSISFNVVYESHSSDFSNYNQTQDLKSDEDKIRVALDKIIKHRQNGEPIKFSISSYKYTKSWDFGYDKIALSSTDIPKSFKPITCQYQKYNCYIDSDGRMYYCFHLRDKTPDLNVKTLGVTKCWAELGNLKIDCRTCYTICNNNTNLMLSLKPSAFIENVIDMVR